MQSTIDLFDNLIDVFASERCACSKPDMIKFNSISNEVNENIKLRGIIYNEN